MRKIALRNRARKIVAYALIDNKDFQKVSKFTWCRDSHGYVVRTNKEKKKIYLHRFLLKAKKGQMIDHVKGNRLDNRREKLRFATRRQNSQNSKDRLNKTGFRGVHLNKPSGLFNAAIKVNGKILSLKYFKTAKEASNAYNKAAKKFFGPFRRKK